MRNPSVAMTTGAATTRRRFLMGGAALALAPAVLTRPAGAEEGARLDPASRALLGLERSPLSQSTPARYRDELRWEADLLNDPPVEVARVEDRIIIGGDEDLPVRLYWPRTAAAGELLPVVVYFHGGGFVAGSMDTHDGIARRLCVATDAIVANVDYRLAPEHPFPAAPRDAIAAVRWVRTNAENFGGDPRRIAVAGDSTGGTLAAVVARLAAGEGIDLAFQLLFYPILSFEPDARFDSRALYGGGDYLISVDDLEWMAGHYITARSDRTDARASPLLARSLEGLPPAFIVTAGFDPFRDEAEIYVSRLRESGVNAGSRRFENTVHHFMFYSPIVTSADIAFSTAGLRFKGAMEAMARRE
jgi:acetyl esterase